MRFCVTAGGDRTRRHHALRDLFAHICDGAGVSVQVEPLHLLIPDVDHPAHDRRRPADVLLPSFARRMPHALDFAVSSPHRRDLVGLASRESLTAAVDYEATKRIFRETALRCTRDGIVFVPMVFEPSGACGPAATRIFRQLLARSALRRGPDRSSQALAVRQRVSLTVRRQAAQAVLRRLPHRAPAPPAAGPAMELAGASAATLEESLPARPWGASPAHAPDAPMVHSGAPAPWAQPPPAASVPSMAHPMPATPQLAPPVPAMALPPAAVWAPLPALSGPPHGAARWAW